LRKSRGQTLAQMAIAWVLRDQRVTSALIGARNVQQLDDSLDALKKLDFSDAELQEIEQHAIDTGIDLWRMIEHIQLVEQILIRCVRLPAELRLESEQHNAPAPVRQLNRSNLALNRLRMQQQSALQRIGLLGIRGQHRAVKPGSVWNAGPPGTSPPATPTRRKFTGSSGCSVSTRSSAPEQKNLSLFTPSSTFCTGKLTSAESARSPSG
jgi:hypothetical protein